MTRAYHNRHPQAHWLGIEVDPAYAELVCRPGDLRATSLELLQD